MNCKKTYTSAKINEDTLFWIFGVELGYIDCKTNSLQDIADEVDRLHTKEEILDIINQQLFY